MKPYDFLIVIVEHVHILGVRQPPVINREVECGVLTHVVIPPYGEYPPFTEVVEPSVSSTDFRQEELVVEITLIHPERIPEQSQTDLISPGFLTLQYFLNEVKHPNAAVGVVLVSARVFGTGVEVAYNDEFARDFSVVY